MKVGIIGLGDMGKMFALKWANSSHDIFGCDLPLKFSENEAFFANTKIKILNDSRELSKICDVIMYCVETENIDKVVEYNAPFTKKGAIVTGQTSVKFPEIKAFEKHFSNDIEIIGSHALFGPNVDPVGQTIAMFNHSASNNNFDVAKKLFEFLGSKIEILENHEVHDKMMADIQVVTHIGFESIGTAFMHRKFFPWHDTSKVSGIDNIKLLLTLRIYGYKPHVYSGMAFQNPFAKNDVRKFASVENEIFGLMISEQKEKFRSKIIKAKEFVFKDHASKPMLNDALMEEYTLNPGKNHKANSHLSLLSMVCTWADLKMNPYKNLICKTPPFKLRVGLAEYLFLNENLLEETINAALSDKSILADDLAFHTAVHEWSNIIELGDEKAYKAHFERTKRFLEPMLAEGRQKSNELISKIN